MPLTRDYIMRMIEILSIALRKILFMKDSKNFTGAFDELNSASKKLVGLDLYFILPMPDAQIIELLNLEKDTAPAKHYSMGILFKEAASIKMMEGKSDEAAALNIKSLSLQLESILKFEKEITEEHKAQIDEVISSIDMDLIPSNVLEKIFYYYKMENRFSKAEDVLFDLIEEDKKHIQTGLQFYEGLLLKSDDELKSGNLPREEVEESLASLREINR